MPDERVSPKGGNVRFERTNEALTEMARRGPAPSLGGDDLVIRLMYELHAHLPEDQRPLSMSDLSDEQAARARKAVHAVLTEWEGAKAALASAGEAGTATTPQSGVVHEHATGAAGDAQTPSRDGSGNATSGNPLPVKHGD